MRWFAILLFTLIAGSALGEMKVENEIIGRNDDGSPVLIWKTATEATTFYYGAEPKPDAWGIDTTVGGPFPPKGDAYKGESAEAHYLWRWLLMSGVDKVVGPELDVAYEEAKYDLKARVDRTPRDIMEAVGPHFTGSFKPQSYLEALALMAYLDKDALREMMEPWLSGETELKPIKGAGTLAGRLVYTELDDKRAVKILRETCEMGFDESGDALEAMPTHNEMSDAVFMACPLLARTGKLTGDSRYFDLCVKHLRFMQEKCLREDGIFRHSPQNEGAWGRGNGFPALGLALTIPSFPEDHSERAFLVESLESHLKALLPYQHESGMWHQLIDRPDSYREFTSTCMITFALVRAKHEGWMEVPNGVIDRAWEAIKMRVSLDGKTFFDACTGTGKQSELEDYYLRTAIQGPDQRSAAMLLTLARELAE